MRSEGRLTSTRDPFEIGLMITARGLALAVLALAGAAGCNNELTPSGYAMFSGPERVTSARVVGGFKSYGGAPLATWTVILGATDGCGAKDNVMQLEIDTVSSGGLTANAAMPVRAVPDTVDTLPSVVLTYGAVTTTSGTVTLDTVATTRLGGDFTIQTSGGMLTGTFDGPICK